MAEKSFGALAETALLQALYVCRFVGLANVPFAGGNKIELKKMCGGENKKYRRVGNECRLTRCTFEIWSVCWSPVKMVYFFSFNFVPVCCVVVFLRLLVTSRYLRRLGNRLPSAWLPEAKFIIKS